MKRSHSFLLVSTFLFAAGPACQAAGSFDPTGENVARTQAAASGMQTELARPTTTPSPAPTAAATARPFVIDDDFSTLDSSRWLACDVCSIKEGRLVMGPYPSSNSPRGYIAICKDCGSVHEYKMSVDATFLSGDADHGFGLVLRERDGDYTGLEITTFQAYGLWFFDSKNGESWYGLLVQGLVPAKSLKPGTGKNHIEVEVAASRARKDKDLLKIRFNGMPLSTIEIPRDRGRVGLGVSLHSIGIAFDNFHFESVPAFESGQEGSG